jgi:hypothetical protein
MSQAFLVKVGANLKENKGLSPFFPDNSFEYIPGVLERAYNANAHHNHRHYSRLNCQNENLQKMHMSSFVKEGTAHVDPEFYTFTYGESRIFALKKLKTLKQNDLILFTSLLQPYENQPEHFVLKGTPNLYVIGFFVIHNENEQIQEIEGPIGDQAREHFAQNCNEHVIYAHQHVQTPQNRKLLLIQGDKNKSLLFKQPLKIGHEKSYFKTFVRNWGIKDPSQTKFNMCHHVENIKTALAKHAQHDNRWHTWKIP